MKNDRFFSRSAVLAGAGTLILVLAGHFMAGLFWLITAALTVAGLISLKNLVDRLGRAAVSEGGSSTASRRAITMTMLFKFPAYGILAYLAAKSGLIALVAFLTSIVSVYSLFVWVVYTSKQPGNTPKND